MKKEGNNLLHDIVKHGRNQRLYHVEAHKKWSIKTDICPSYFIFQIANNKCADQTARKRSLVCAFVVPKQQNRGFSR